MKREQVIKMLRDGRSPYYVSAASGVSLRMVRKWAAEEGVQLPGRGMNDCRKAEIVAALRRGTPLAVIQRRHKVSPEKLKQLRDELTRERAS